MAVVARFQTGLSGHVHAHFPKLLCLDAEIRRDGGDPIFRARAKSHRVRDIKILLLVLVLVQDCLPENAESRRVYVQDMMRL